MLKKLYRFYCRIEEISVGIFITAIVALTFSNAVLRAFDKPITVTDDICLFLFSWAALLGADVAFRYSRLVGMDMLVTKFPPKWQKFFQVLVYVIMIGAMVFFVNYGFGLARRNWARTFNSLPISYGWITVSFPISCCLMIFTAILKIIKVVTHFKDDSYNVKNDNPDKVGEEYTGADLEPGISGASNAKVEKP